MSKFLTKEQIRVLYGLPADDAGNVYAHGRAVKFHNSAKRSKRPIGIEELLKYKPAKPEVQNVEADVIEQTF